MGPLEEIIRNRIRDHFPTSTFTLLNESKRHQGHKGHTGGNETHFHLILYDKAFEGCSSLQRQRQVIPLFQDLMQEGLHALSMELMPPT